MNSLPSCSKRWATFTVSPTTVKLTRPGAPMLPTTAGPECRPMRTRIGVLPAARAHLRCPRWITLAIASAARIAAAGMVLGAPDSGPHTAITEVADVLVDDAVLVLDAGAEQGEVVVEQLGGLVLGQVLGLRRELDDVGEHHREVDAGARRRRPRPPPSAGAPGAAARRRRTSAARRAPCRGCARHRRSRAAASACASARRTPAARSPRRRW